MINRGKAVKDFAGAADSMNELLAKRQGKDSLIASLVNDPKPKRVLTDLASMVHDVRQVAADIAEVRGTVGGLIKAPTLDENLTALLEGARRSWILRTVMQSAVNTGQEGGTPRSNENYMADQRFEVERPEEVLVGCG